VCVRGGERVDRDTWFGVGWTRTLDGKRQGFENVSRFVSTRASTRTPISPNPVGFGWPARFVFRISYFVRSYFDRD
jgi:hypothetical protein